MVKRSSHFNGTIQNMQIMGATPFSKQQKDSLTTINENSLLIRLWFSVCWNAGSVWSIFQDTKLEECYWFLQTQQAFQHTLNPTGLRTLFSLIVIKLSFCSCEKGADPQTVQVLYWPIKIIWTVCLKNLNDCWSVRKKENYLVLERTFSCSSLATLWPF